MTKMLANVLLLIVLICSPVQASQDQDNPQNFATDSNIADVAEYVLIAGLVLSILNRIK